ncbi:MAG: ZIP family metal transporter [Promethearchaeota archaeon]|jgi:zinc and cadmium transporter
MLIWIILFAIFGSVGAICASGVFILAGERIQKILIPALLSFATGILLTAAFMGLIPEAIESAGNEPHVIMPIILGGIFFFFFLEKFVIWRNCQDNACEVHAHAPAPVVLIGDAFHNFTDGIVIAAAFLTNFNIGIAAGITILIHEIPQETGDFGILLHDGMSKKKAFIYNLLSSSITIPSAILGYFILEIFHGIVPIFLALSAASFIYIALSDLTPELHQSYETKAIIKQIILVLSGILIMFLILSIGSHGH